MPDARPAESDIVVPARRRARSRRALLAAASLGAGLALLVGAYRAARSRTWQVAGRIVARGPASPRRVALTFDDGPTRAYADTLLALLASRGVHATFFVVGREMRWFPDVAPRLVAAGHELGNHSWTHDHLVLRSAARYRAEVDRTDSAIHAAGQPGMPWFRPPYGVKLVGLPRHLARTGHTTVTWSVEPESYPADAATPDGIVRHVLARVQPGAIILLHPWYPSRAVTRAAIVPLIDSLHARGYAIGTVRELLGR